MSILTHFRRLSLLLLVAAGLATPSVARADTKAVAPINMTADGLAIKGYDAVAYFTDHKPVKGLAQYEFQWQGAKYRFASADHRDLFVANPGKYVPQYGGYCAFALAHNGIADISPRQWAVVDDKLYLNNNGIAYTLWAAAKKSNIASADKNWEKKPKTAPSDTPSAAQ